MLTHRVSRVFFFLATAIATLTSPALAQSHSLAQPIAVKDVRLEAKTDAAHKTIVLRDGRIESVLAADAPLPTGARVIDGKGNVAVPPFVDAFTQAGCAMPPVKADRDVPASTRSDVQIDMREANRKGIAPAFRAADVFDLSSDKAKGYRESGFGWLVSAPSGELLSGCSVLATSREGAARDQIILPVAFSHGEFRASGSGYPGTPMGYVAQLRQFFLDAQRQRELELRFSQHRPGPRPPFDADLSAARPLLLRERRLLCAADSDLAIERWIKLADEQGVDVGVTGGRAAFKLAALLAARKIPVVLTLDWGEEPKDPHEKEKEEARKKAEAEKKKPEDKPAADASVPQEKPAAPAAKPEDEAAKASKDEAKLWDYEEPLVVREEKRRLWEEGRDCAMQLQKAGVPFAFGSGSASPADLLKKIRTLVEKGLSREAALDALCVTPAQWLGLGEHLGAISPGKDATFALWTDDPLGKDAQVAWMFVDGFPHEFEIKKKEGDSGPPKEGTTAAGHWEITTEGRQGKRTSQMQLEMSADGTVTGKWTNKSPRDETETTTDVTGHLGGTTLTVEGKLMFGENEVPVTLSGELAGDAWSGNSTSRRGGNENVSPFTATRKPKQEDLR
ncbi:MAG TPA: amidohydrolase family protein [Planctomycetota bacterium]|nr:amidohydrolase family protein [Planctomycetota bacterium]